MKLKLFVIENASINSKENEKVKLDFQKQFHFLQINIIIFFGT